MKYQALFSSKDKSKNLKSCLLQFLFGALRIKQAHFVYLFGACLIQVRLYLLSLLKSVEQLVGHLTRKSGVLGSIPGLATYFPFSFCFFKKGSCQLLVKVCARSTG